MTIVVQLDRVLYERELTLTELSNRIGLTVANLSILKTGKARAIRFSTLEALCRELQCQPGDLLQHVDVEQPQSPVRPPPRGLLSVQADTNLDSEAMT